MTRRRERGGCVFQKLAEPNGKRRQFVPWACSGLDRLCNEGRLQLVSPKGSHEALPKWGQSGLGVGQGGCGVGWGCMRTHVSCGFLINVYSTALVAKLHDNNPFESRRGEN